MPDQALQQARAALGGSAAPSWEAKLAVDLGAALLVAEVDFADLPAEAQEQARAKGYGPGDAVTLVVSATRGQPVSFDLWKRDTIPDLSFIASGPPRLSPEAAARIRALRKAMADPSMTDGMRAWAQADFGNISDPAKAWAIAGDDPNVTETVYGTEIAVTRFNGAALLESDLIDNYAGGGAAAWLGGRLDGADTALVRNEDFGVTYVRARLEGGRFPGPPGTTDTLLHALLERWLAEAPPPAEDETLAAAAASQPDEPEPTTPQVAEPCWFCGGAADEGAASEVLLYAPESIQRSTYGGGVVVQHEVRYRQLRVAVPRCNRCRKAHNRQTGFEMLGTLAGVVAGVALAYAVYAAMGAFGITGALRLVGWAIMVVTVFAGLVAGYRFGASRGKARTDPGIAPEDANLRYPTVKHLLDEGFQLGEPSVQN